MRERQVQREQMKIRLETADFMKIALFFQKITTHEVVFSSYFCKFAP